MHLAVERLGVAPRRRFLRQRRTRVSLPDHVEEESAAEAEGEDSPLGVHRTELPHAPSAPAARSLGRCLKVLLLLLHPVVQGVTLSKEGRNKTMSGMEDKQKCDPYCFRDE
ncbi:hypothetical protein CRENBAI_025781 [Crenichthys baileyi]|uniref:Uncharacterized protein n=1 Tax=Crenichthys baileyi TaxID=28760 RepID=A0AAV9SDN3_9TELE